MALSTMSPLPMKGWDECDYFTDWCKHYYNYGPGLRKFWKNNYNRRVRRSAKFFIQEYLD